ncbi:RAD52 family DNA repair protein [Pelotomaculum isophthalicicum JI]|uniref:RAD52 family DNA repair protein n=1 Tax=Pelotomaculum isophthalicicum JI TaxID=947010 RepID=A0A9X4H1J8_9FIRM|nr:Rad52/Rad22 family DNA repair protein [Pelotomaculum isophthalicicum]MDF9408196.1 RAD52 family DNA repair protein [Pelotomaculum isophthalicicum JI]
MAIQASERDFIGAAGDRQPNVPLPGALTLLDLPAIYRDFCSELPVDAIQRTKGRETRKGYDTDGYGYQYCIDMLNNVAGLGHWRIISEEVFCDEGEYNNGRKAYEVGYDVVVQIGNWTPAGFEVLAETPRTPGGHVSALKNDARKGALTNAIKKALAFFGIGAAAYRGELDDDNLLPGGREDLQEKTGQNPPPRPQNQPQQNRTQSQPPAQGAGKATDRQLGMVKGTIERAAQAAGFNMTLKDQAFLGAVLSAAGLSAASLDDLTRQEASYLIENAAGLVNQAIFFLETNRSGTHQTPPPGQKQAPPASRGNGQGNSPRNSEGNGRRRLF